MVPLSLSLSNAYVGIPMLMTLGNEIELLVTDSEQVLLVQLLRRHGVQQNGTKQNDIHQKNEGTLSAER